MKVNVLWLVIPRHLSTKKFARLKGTEKGNGTKLQENMRLSIGHGNRKVTQSKKIYSTNLRP